MPTRLLAPSFYRIEASKEFPHYVHQLKHTFRCRLSIHPPAPDHRRHPSASPVLGKTVQAVVSSLSKADINLTILGPTSMAKSLRRALEKGHHYNRD
jgi:hypothetical protein